MKLLVMSSLLVSLSGSVMAKQDATTSAEPAPVQGPRQEPEVILTDKGVVINNGPTPYKPQPAPRVQLPPSPGPAYVPGRGGNMGNGRVTGNNSWNWSRKKINSDAVVTKRNRKIVFDKKDTPDLKVDGLLIFGKEEINVGPVTWTGNTGSVTVSKEVFTQISQRHVGEVGKLNMKVGNNGNWYFENDEEGVRVYVAGSDDDCRHPVYLTDHDGTISSHDKCTTETIDHIIDSQNATFFVISSNGSSMKDKILAANYKNKDKILVLGKSAVGNWGAAEKAVRVFTYFSNSGACIAGFAGDTPSVDGEASRTLNVPYLAVNQREEEEAEVTHTMKKVCSLNNELRSTYELTLQGDKNCPDQYNEHDSRTEIECRRQIYTLGRLDGEPAQPEQPPQTYWTEKPGFLGIGGGAGCYVGDEETGKKRKIKLCRRPLPMEMKPTDKNECHAGYDLEERQVMHRRVVGMKPTFNIQEFPEGSLWSKDWCELGQKIDGKK